MKFLSVFSFFLFSPFFCFYPACGQVQKATPEHAPTVYLLDIKKGSPQKDSAAVPQVFKKADVLVLEAHPDSLSLQNQRLFVEEGFYKDHLKKHLPSRIFAQLDTLLSQLGHPLGHMPRMKPWLITQTLFDIEGQRNGDYQEALPRYLLDQATTHDLKLQLLEPNDKRKLLLARLPDKAQIHYLSRTLNMHEQLSSKEFIEKEATLFPVAIQQFLYRQNKEWSLQIMGLLNHGQTPIIAIDYRYIQGEEGLVEILKKEGVKIVLL